MARDHARVTTSIWSNPDFTALSGDAQRVFIMALSQPSMSYAGVVPFTLRRWVSLSKDATEGTIREAVAELQAARFVLLDEDTEELWVRTFVKGDGVLKSPNIIKRMVSDVRMILSPMIRSAFAWEWHTNLVGLLSDKHRKACLDDLETLPETPSQNPWEGLQERVTEGVSLARAAPAPAPTPAPYPPGGDGAPSAAGKREKFSTRLARELSTSHDVQLDPADTAHGSFIALFKAARQKLPPDRHHDTAMGVIADYVETAQGWKLTRESRSHTARLIRTHDPGDVLDAYGEAMNWGAGIDAKYAGDPLALSKYVAGVLAKRKARA